MVITGTGFQATNGYGPVTSVNFNADPAASFHVDSATQVTAISPGTDVLGGPIDVRVTNGVGTSPVTPADHYTYVEAPSVTGVSPSSGPTAGGTTVTITGTGFQGTGGVGGVSGPGGVTFDGVNAVYTVNGPTQVTATSPAHAAGTIDVVVRSHGGTSSITATDHFTYVAPPALTGINPARGPTAGGQPVTITGTSFQSSGTTQVTIGGTAATNVTVTGPTTITATTPAHAVGTVSVVVTNPDGQASPPSNSYTYVTSPIVTAVAPDHGSTAGGDNVVITGTGFWGGTSASNVTNLSFGSTTLPSAGYTVDSDVQVTVTSTPSHVLGILDVRVTTAGGQSAVNISGCPSSPCDQFTYIAPVPTVTAVSPGFGPIAGGTPVTITGTGFTGATAVSFGAADAPGYSVTDDQHITVSSPPAPGAGAGMVHVTVTTGGGTSSTGANDHFTYVAAPTITAIAPHAGPAGGGTVVTITGTGFLGTGGVGGVTGASGVKFGQVNAATYTVNSATQLTTTSPAAPGGTVHIRVTSGGGTSAPVAADQFNVVGPPSIIGVSPSSGPTTGGNTVQVTGSGFFGGTNGPAVISIKFGGTSVPGSNYTVSSDTTIFAIVPAHAAGAVAVVVTTNNGPSSPDGSYTYVIPIGGVTLDGYGGLHTYGNRFIDTSGAIHWGWDIARSVALKANGSGGYTLDGYGGVHRFGGTTSISDGSHAYWSGWDIARGIAICGDGNRGYTLDGWGGVHNFGGTQAVADGSHAYWPNWDIARGIVITADCQGGYTLDGWGGIHSFGAALPIGDNTHAYWSGWDIARGIVLRADGHSGYTLDGYGGVHNFGGAAAVSDTSHATWSGWDIANGIDLDADGLTGYTLDGWGGVHSWAAPAGTLPPAVADNRPGAYWPGWDIARGIGGS